MFQCRTPTPMSTNFPIFWAACDINRETGGPTLRLFKHVLKNAPVVTLKNSLVLDSGMFSRSTHEVQQRPILYAEVANYELVRYGTDDVISNAVGNIYF